MARKKTRYVIVGTGGRSLNFITPLVTSFKDNNELVAFCDTNQGRMDYYNKELVDRFGFHAVPTYLAKDFDRMIRETKADVVIVTTIDAYHDKYIVRGMELGCDVITEKPMVTDEKKCRAVFDAIKRTGRKLRVTFNARWSPGATLVKQMLSEGIIGEILHVDMEYLLDTSHGADYFRRWHREKKMSGGLMLTKSTHHFDLVNWWIDAVPEEVFGFGRLAYYGRKNAEKRGIKVKHDRYTGHENKNDPFAMTLDGSVKGRVASDRLKGLYLDAEKYDGYVRDRNVFGDNIDIEDTMSVLVKYRTGVVLNYSLNAYLPREGFTVVFNGTKGRLEFHQVHSAHVIAGMAPDPHGRGEAELRSQLIVQPEFDKAYEVEIPTAKGGHGGADPPLLTQIFSPKVVKEKWDRNAGYQQGAASLLIGAAANKSFKTGKAIKIEKLCPALPKTAHLSDLI
jgi:predicted dehydrogenase